MASASKPLQFLRGAGPEGAAARFALPGRWRRLLVWQVPLLVAGLLSAANYFGLFALANGLFFDAVTIREPGRRPQVVIVEADPAFERSGAQRHARLAALALARGARRVAFAYDPATSFAGAGIDPDRVVVARRVERVPGGIGWRYAERSNLAGATASAGVIAGGEYGIHRGQLRSLPARGKALPVFEVAASGGVNATEGETYLVRMSRRQNLPRIAASQLERGDIDRQAIAGLILLIAPPGGVQTVPLATPARPGAANATAAEFSAFAVQNLATGRAVTRLPLRRSAILLFAVSLLFAAGFLRLAITRLAMPLAAIAAVVIIALAVLALLLGHVLLPVSELALAPLLIAPMLRARARASAERHLQRFVTRAVSFSSRRTLLRDHTRLPGFLVTSARLIGVRRMLLLQAEPDGKLNPLAAIDASPDDLIADSVLRDVHFRQARLSRKPRDAGQLLPGWGPGARIVGLGATPGATYWLYSLSGSSERRIGERMAAALAFSYREVQRWRVGLGARAVVGKQMKSLENWMGSAVNHVTDQGEQLRQGLDALDTAVMIYHFIGYPLQANERMAELYLAAGLSLSDTTLPDAMERLTGLDSDAITRMVNHLMFHGGEMRVPCLPIDTRARILRVAVPEALAGGRTRAIVVEAIDITEVRKLAELRLAVASFIDSQLRNDLATIGLAASLAANPRLEKPALLRVIGKIETAAHRANDRLAEISTLTHDDRDPEMSESYPINARDVLADVCIRIKPLADDLDVIVTAELPALSGLSIAAPATLADMVEAMLRLVVADSPQGSAVQLAMTEETERTRITVHGGIGISFERLYAALDAPPDLAPAHFRAISAGMTQAVGWGGMVSYSSAIGDGYRFTIEMRRIG